MEWILTFLQITTPRSAKVFLFGSAALFLFGLYAFSNIMVHEQDAETITFVAIFYSIWFLITGSYVGLGGWVLFSDKGKELLTKTQARTKAGHRNLFWYFRFLFACYAAGFASFLVVGIVALPFYGFHVLTQIGETRIGLYLLAMGAIWAPFIYRYLK